MFDVLGCIPEDNAGILCFRNKQALYELIKTYMHFALVTIILPDIHCFDYK